MTMMLSLIEIDHTIFHFVNTGLSNSFFDAVLPLLREKLFWVPTYLFIVSFALFNFKTKGIYLVLFLFLNFGISDTVSSKFIKKTVQRIRPCNDVNINQDMTLRVHCGGGYSFTSSHATNHFALSFFLITTIGFISKRLIYALIFWAGIVSFAQVYVGVHFPLDVIAGAILGIIIGKLLGKMFNRFFKIEES